MSALWKPGVTFDVFGTPVALQNLVRDAALIVHRAALALADAGRASRRQRLHLGADPRSRETVRRRSSSPSFRCWRCCRPGRNGPFAFLLAAVTANDGLPHEAAYFWLTGMLSAFLDNAPTYLVFFELAGGDAAETDGPARRHAGRDLDGRGLHGRAHLYRQRAEFHGLCDRDRSAASKMPSFFGYLLWAALILVPLFVLLTLLPIAPILKLG